MSDKIFKVIKLVNSISLPVLNNKYGEYFYLPKFDSKLNIIDIEHIYLSELSFSEMISKGLTNIGINPVNEDTYNNSIIFMTKIFYQVGKIFSQEDKNIKLTKNAMMIKYFSIGMEDEKIPNLINLKIIKFVESKMNEIISEYEIKEESNNVKD